MGAWFSANEQNQPSTNTTTTKEVSVIVTDPNIARGVRSDVARNTRAIPSTPMPSSASLNASRRGGSITRLETAEVDYGKAARGVRKETPPAGSQPAGRQPAGRPPNANAEHSGTLNASPSAASILKRARNSLVLQTQLRSIPKRPVHMTLSSSAMDGSRARLNTLHKKTVSFFEFRGLMAPVFTCFKNDATQTLVTNAIPKYAKWLKDKGIEGVLVNGLAGESPALGLYERKVNAESWWSASSQLKLTMMVQIGGAPLPDVLDLAIHAEVLGVHGVMCLPELFYKPKTVQQLVGYCKIVARHCSSIPFFYYHVPMYTDVDFDMREFCDLAEEVIPNFYGIQFADRDLQIARNCFHEKRVVFCGISSLLGPALLLGFKSGLMAFLNVRPDLGLEIYNAYKNNNLSLMRLKQNELNFLMKENIFANPPYLYTLAMKEWFNKDAFKKDRSGFSVGPYRKLF